MKRKSHKPPSKARYDEFHPTISIRVTKELYDQLNELREQGGKSLGDILREALKQQSPSTKKAYQQGYDAAKGEFAVSYKCSVCGGNLTVTSQKEKEAIARYMREHGWGHSKCVR
jgi:metal-responsive CopG/Arc/MetJ family transcriptional regulator